MRKTQNNLFDSPKQNDENTDFFSNTVLTNNESKASSEKTNTIYYPNTIPSNIKDFQIEKTKNIMNNNESENIIDRQNSKNPFNENATKEKNIIKNSEDNNSFIKEFQDLMKEANSQPKTIVAISDPSSSSKQNKTPIVNEFNPFENLNKMAKENSYKDKNAKDSNYSLGLINSARSPYSSDILFPPKIDINTKNYGNNNNNNFNSHNDIKTQNKKELNDEDYLNNLLGITNDFNKTIKKDSSSEIKKKPSAAFLVPGTQGMDLSNLDYNSFDNPNVNKNNSIKEANFFKDLEKETIDLKKSNSNNSNDNLNIFEFPSGKKNDIGINKLFEDIVKEEEKKQQKKAENFEKKEANKNDNFNDLSLDLESNINNTSEKLDKEFKKIPISLAQFEYEKVENASKMKKKKVYLK